MTMIDRDRRTIDELLRQHESGAFSRRDLLTRAAALGLSGAALAAVGGGRFAAAQDATPSPETLALGDFSGRTLRLSVALAEDEAGVFQEVVVGGFEDATGGNVELIRIEAADVIRTLEAQVGSGNIEIDMLTQDNNSLAPLVNGGLVEELPEATEIIPQETIPALLEVLQFDGTYYFLPARPNVQITYYNERVFDEIGVTPPQTWDELLSVGQAIAEASGVGRVSIQGVPGGAVGVTVTQFLWQAGGDPLQINNEAGVQAFEFMQSLRPYLTPQYPTATFDTTNTYLLNESVVLAQNWPFGVNVIVREGGKEEIKTYAGWSGPAGNALVLGGDVLAITKGSQNRDMGLDFARFFMSRDVQSTLTARLGWPAIRTDAFGQVEEWQQPYFDTIREALEVTRPRPNVTYWLQVEQILSDAFNDIVTNGADVQPTLDNYQSRIDELTGGA